jgi:hypothetical protein
MLDMLRGEVADPADLLIGKPFTVPQTQDLPVPLVDNISVDGLAHFKAIIPWHNTPPKKIMPPLL